MRKSLLLWYAVHWDKAYHWIENQSQFRTCIWFKDWTGTGIGHEREKIGMHCMGPDDYGDWIIGGMSIENRRERSMTTDVCCRWYRRDVYRRRYVESKVYTGMMMYTLGYRIQNECTKWKNCNVRSWKRNIVSPVGVVGIRTRGLAVDSLVSPGSNRAKLPTRNRRSWCLTNWAGEALCINPSYVSQ